MFGSLEQVKRVGSDGEVANKKRKSSSTENPLVVLLDGRDCVIELGVLRDVATIAFCDAQTMDKIHDRVLNEAVTVLVWDSMDLTKEDLIKFKRLRHIVKVGSSLYNVDIKAAGELGIAVSNVPGVGIEEKADSTFSFILNLYRKTFWLAKMVELGTMFNGVEQVALVAAKTPRIRGETLGIVGFSKVGHAVAIRAKAFGFNVVIYDPYLKKGAEHIFGVERVGTLRELLTQANCVILLCPLNADNVYMINEETLKQMRRGAYLINVSHEGLINEEALASALARGHLGGAALDDRENSHESILTGPLKNAPNLICTPKTASLSDPSVEELRRMAANEVRRGLTGKIPDALRNCVNLDYLAKSDGERLWASFESGAGGTGMLTPDVAVTQYVGAKRPLKTARSSTETAAAASSTVTGLPATPPNPLRHQPGQNATATSVGSTNAKNEAIGSNRYGVPTFLDYLKELSNMPGPSGSAQPSTESAATASSTVTGLPATPPSPHLHQPRQNAVGSNNANNEAFGSNRFPAFLDYLKELTNNPGPSGSAQPSTRTVTATSSTTAATGSSATPPPNPRRRKQQNNARATSAGSNTANNTATASASDPIVVPSSFYDFLAELIDKPSPSGSGQ